MRSPVLFLAMVWFALLTSADPLGADEGLNVLDAKQMPEPRKMLHGYLLHQARKHFETRRDAVAALKTAQDIHKRQEELKARFIEALGGFPEKSPLKARVVGKVQRDGYRIEKVIYESRPEHHVTATLYLPDGKPPFPAVLMPIGHSAAGKADGSVQRGAILLARHGIAALAYDPISQGERRQLLDDKGKPGIPSMTNEHTMIGVGAILLGSNTATYRIWDGIRSLDYLASRPEIDSKRLGCTGCSGGGTLTSYLMALDDRIVAAAPSCFITSLERLFATIGPQDAEQNITGQVAFGMEHSDYLNMRAPRPTLILAAKRDFFDIQGTQTSFQEAKRTYGLLGHGQRVDLFESDGGHGYPRSQREAMLRWMRRWLLDKDDAPKETDVEILKDRDLWCTRTGQVLEELKGRSAFDLNAELARELTRRRAAARRESKELAAEVSRHLAVQLPARAAEVKETGFIQREGYRVRKLVHLTESGILVPGLLFSPEKDSGQPLLVYLHAQGKATDAGPGGRLEKMARAGRRVLALDLRGVGETAPAAASRPSTFGVDYKEAYMALHLNRPLLGQRVQDLLVVIEQLAADNPAGIHLMAVGNAGPVALHAAFLDARIKQLTLEQSLGSWTSVARTPLSQDQLTNAIPGVLKVYDLPELAAALAPRPLTIHQPTDAARRPLTRAAIKEVYDSVRSAYERHSASKHLLLLDSLSGEDGARPEK